MVMLVLLYSTLIVKNGPLAAGLQQQLSVKLEYGMVDI